MTGRKRFCQAETATAQHAGEGEGSARRWQKIRARWSVQRRAEIRAGQVRAPVLGWTARMCRWRTRLSFRPEHQWRAARAGIFRYHADGGSGSAWVRGKWRRAAGSVQATARARGRSLYWGSCGSAGGSGFAAVRAVCRQHDRSCPSLAVTAGAAGFGRRLQVAPFRSR